MRKLTHAEHVADINKVNPNVEVLGEIINVRTKVLCRCKICHHEWEVRPQNLKIGQGCPACAEQKKGQGRKLPHTEHIEAISKVNPNIEILEEIKNVGRKVLCKCKICHHEWRAIPGNLKRGHGCPECARIKRTKLIQNHKLTHEEHVAAISKINPDVEALEEIKGNKIKTLFRCKICGHEWLVTPNSLKHRRSSCPECARLNKRTKGLTHTEQVAAITKVNPNVEILEKITKNNKGVLCRCKICGHEWSPRPSNLKRGCGCPKCYRVKSRAMHSKSHEYHLKEIKNANKTVEVLEKITNVGTPVLCKCKICSHEWFTRPTDLKQGHGCPKCAKTGFLSHSIGKLYVMVDDLNVPTMMKIGVSVEAGKRRKEVLQNARKAGVSIPALYVVKTWEGPTEVMQNIEQMMHDRYAEWNIKFSTKFDGYTEFFYYTPETEKVFDVIDEIYYTVVNQF